MWVKRTIDVAFSSIGSIFLSPILILLSLLILIDSRGAILYKQLRIGRYEVPFYILKFRTMIPNSDVESKLTIGNKDARITKIGYYLRKYKLDELPQLFNVLKGDMSLVGPRPEVAEFVNLYTEEQKKVLNVKPGITDLASIMFSNENELLASYEDPISAYTHCIMPKKIELNLAYIATRNNWIDLKIIVKTIKKIIC